MKTDFDNKDFALSLDLKLRSRWTRKWPIVLMGCSLIIKHYYYWKWCLNAVFTKSDGLCNVSVQKAVLPMVFIQNSIFQGLSIRLLYWDGSWTGVSRLTTIDRYHFSDIFPLFQHWKQQNKWEKNITRKVGIKRKGKQNWPNVHCLPQRFLLFVC